MNQTTADRWPNIPGYSLERQLGEGGMGIVYLARQASLNRQVAIKVARTEILSTQELVDRFEREIAALARLRHPHIVHIYDRGTVAGQPYYVMEHHAGGTLAERMEGGLSVAESIVIMTQIGHAVCYAHRHGIIHRDIKPSNVLFNDQHQAVLSDFGIATDLNRTSLTRAGTVLGSQAYASPEQREGRTVDGRTDIYSAGVMFHEMLVGHRPRSDTPTLPPTLPPLTVDQRDRLQAIVEKMVAPQLSAHSPCRYPSMEACLTDLAGLVTPPPCSCRAYIKSIGMLAIACMVAMGSLFWFMHTPSSAGSVAHDTPESPLPVPGPQTNPVPRPTEVPKPAPPPKADLEQILRNSFGQSR